MSRTLTSGRDLAARRPPQRLTQRQRSRFKKQTAVAAVLAATLAIAACGSGDGGTGPSNPGAIDVASINAHTDQLRAIMAQPVLAAVIARGQFSIPTFDRLAAHVAHVMLVANAARLGPRTPSAAAAIVPTPGERSAIPDSLLGHTLALDAQGHYAVDPTRTGAPANGVRFIIYPAGSTQELGYAQVIDSSSSSATRISIDLVTAAGLTVLHSDDVVPLTGGDVVFSGFVTNGTDHVDYSIIERSTTTTTGSRDAIFLTVTAPTLGTKMLDTTVVDGLAAQDVEVIRLSAGSTTLRFATPTVVDAVNGGYQLSDTSTVTVNDAPYATIITSATSAPIIRGRNGATLSGSEQDAIVRVIEADLAVFEVLLVPLVVSAWVAGVGGTSF